MTSLFAHRFVGRRTAQLGLLALSLASTACGNEAGAPGFDISMRPGPAPTAVPLAISLAGDDVVLDWSAAGLDGSATLYRSTDPSLLADLRTGSPGDAVELLVGSSSTSFTDVGAASRSQATPTYYYAVVVETNDGSFVSAMGMKISTAMAPGYNKMAVCMEGGPSRASDVVAQLGSSVGGVWGWDAVSQSYVHWTPLDGVGGDADFALPLGSVFAAEVDGSTPAFQSLVGIVPATNDDFTVSARPGYNWATLPVSYDGPTQASYWVGQAGYWGIGRWNNLTQSQSWYWSAQDPDFDLEACRPHYTYLPPNACSSSEDCSEDAFCYFVDPAACGDAAAGLCKARPIGCEDAPQGEVCGCDGVTYGSACEAEQAGATVASEGACPVTDECVLVECQNGGVCSDLPGLDSWECTCAPGYTGTNCETEIDECESSPCFNGECSDLVNGWECQCNPGWQGSTCEVLSSCDGDPCQNGGTCIETPLGQAVCQCAPGWHEADCSEAYDACGGELEDLGSTVPQSVSGSLDGLSDDLDSSCSYQGGPDRAYMFTAPAAGGYRFDTEGSEFDAVLSVMSSCGGPELSCDDDSGTGLMSRIDLVLEEGETVYLMFDSWNQPEPGASYQLNISTVDIDESVCPCADDTLLEGSYAAFFTMILDAPTSCSEDGTSVTGVNSFLGIPDTVRVFESGGHGFCDSQLLTYGFGRASVLASPTQVQSCIDLFAESVASAGLVCGAGGGTVDECETSPCVNGGNCIDGPDVDDWACECLPGYTGSACEIEIDECESSPCVNGDCHDLVNAWECECLPGFTGLTCDTAEPQAYDCETNNPCTPENAEAGQFYFQHSDPSTFVQCSEWGQCFEASCPPGLTWNQLILTCDSPTPV